MKLFQTPAGSYFKIEADSHLYKMIFNQPDGVTFFSCDIYGDRIGADIDIENYQDLQANCEYAQPDTLTEWEAIPEAVNVIKIEAASEEYICEIVATSEGDTLTEKDWEHARLIAAAPKMRDLLITDQWVLKDLIGWLEKGDLRPVVATLKTRLHENTELLNIISGKDK